MDVDYPFDATDWEDMEDDYKEYWRMKESKGKRREKDDKICYHEEEVNDPRYELFLKHLKKDGTSYILEYEEDGVPLKIKYEEELSVDEEYCEVEPARKLRSVTKKINGPSDQMFGVEDQHKREMGKKQANKLKSKKEDNVKSSKKMVVDPDFNIWLKFTSFSQDKMVCKFKGETVVYYEGGKNNVGGKNNDGSFDGVEIIDHDTFLKEKSRGFSKEPQNGKCKTEWSDGSESLEDEEETTDFRQEVITLLRKPYDEHEHERLLQDIKFRRQEERHLDLRNGRERSYSTSKEGKSYLDHYPVLGRKLAQVRDDKLTCLNLLRGFFLYIKQSEPPFRPWEDAECCAITPMGSAMNGNSDYSHKPGPSKTWHDDFSS